MLHWALCFFAVAIGSAILGFSGWLIAPLAGILKILFFIFVILTLVALIADLGNKRGES